MKSPSLSQSALLQFSSRKLCPNRQHHYRLQPMDSSNLRHRVAITSSRFLFMAIRSGRATSNRQRVSVFSQAQLKVTESRRRMLSAGTKPSLAEDNRGRIFPRSHLVCRDVLSGPTCRAIPRGSGTRIGKTELIHCRRLMVARRG